MEDILKYFFRDKTFKKLDTFVRQNRKERPKIGGKKCHFGVILDIGTSSSADRISLKVELNKNCFVLFTNLFFMCKFKYETGITIIITIIITIK